MRVHAYELGGIGRMALLEGEAYRVKFFYEQTGNEAMMIANWLLLNFTEGATETHMAEMFLNVFEATVIAPIRASNSSLVKVEVQETFGGLEYGSADGNIVGGKGDTPMPPHDALSIRQNVGTHLVRPGQKRIPFLTEALNVGGVPQLSAQERTAIEAGFGTIIEMEYEDAVLGTLIFELRPLVVGVTWAPNMTPPQYVLDPAKQVYVTSAEVIKISTQNSRKT